LTDQVLFFFGLVAAFVIGGALMGLIMRKSSAKTVADAVEASLKELGDKLQGFELARERVNTSLKEQIANLASSELQLQKETARLASALRSPGVRGRWGEMQLRRVVELAGMAEHCDFTEQPANESDGKKTRPDMVIHLPNGRSVVVDAKTPLAAYLEASESTDEALRTAKLKDHAAHVRTQIVRLSAKSYWDQLADTPEFVVLFLPGESFFSAALMQEPELLEYGADRKVILATPTTLIALLKTVAYGWRQQRAAERAEEIRELGSDLYERLRALSNELAVLGSQLERSVHAFNRTVGAWEGKVVPGARRLHELGAGSGEAVDSTRIVDTPVRIPRGQ
jgi:DNA recombination protein RmuC